jgi:hydroxyacylglutathione hydrolase
MILETRAVGPFYKNGYLLGCEETRDGVVIDPGDEIEDLIGLAGSHKLTIRHILLTHGHVDHVAGVGRACAALGAPVYLHRDDLPLYQTAVQQGEFFGLSVKPQPPVDRFYGECPPIRFGAHAGRRLPLRQPAGPSRQEALRRGHAVRGIDWPDGPAGR